MQFLVAHVGAGMRSIVWELGDHLFPLVIKGEDVALCRLPSLNLWNHGSSLGVCSTWCVSGRVANHHEYPHFAFVLGGAHGRWSGGA